MLQKVFTVSQKIAAGYLLIALFSLVALGYALTSLHRQTVRGRQIVTVEFRAANLLRDLRQTILAQERLEKQLLILRDPDLHNLVENRRQEFQANWQDLAPLPLPATDIDLPNLVHGYQAAEKRCGTLSRNGRWKEAAACTRATGDPARRSLLKALETLSSRQEAAFDQALTAFSEDSSRAYRVTLFLVLAGLLLSAPVAMTVILGIHRSTRALVQAAQEIARGSFDCRVEFRGNDEFTLLGREFCEMGRKLKELEERSLDANPLTRLPGNRVIDQEVELRIAREEAFAHLYIDLDNFKAYGDRYGYKEGSNVIAEVGDLIRRVLRVHGSDHDFVGHIGGDDYVVLTDEERAEGIAREMVAEFDQLVPQFYSAEDRQAGCFVARDRFGVERTFPLMTISIAIVCSRCFATPTPVAIGRECAKMKEHLKELPGSNFLLNRRTFA